MQDNFECIFKLIVALTFLMYVVCSHYQYSFTCFTLYYYFGLVNNQIPVVWIRFVNSMCEKNLVGLQSISKTRLCGVEQLMGGVKKTLKNHAHAFPTILI